MLIIRKNEVNNPIATVSMNKTLSNPYYLFSFQHIASKERVSFIPQVVTSNCRYDRFRFIETTNTDLSLTPPAVNFPYLGQYYYSIYEQVTSGNTNPALAFNKLESGRAVVILGNDNSDDCFFEPYISNDEDFANIIYLSEQEEECIDTINCCISNELLYSAGTPAPQVFVLDGFFDSSYIMARRLTPIFTYDSTLYQYLCKVKDNGEYDSSFNVSGIPLYNATTDNYKVNNEKIVFSLRGITPDSGLYVLDTTGALVQSLTDFSNITTILVTAPFELLDDNSIIVFGSFSGYNGTNLYGVAKFDSNGNLDPISSSNGFANLLDLTVTMDNAKLFLDNNGKLLLLIDNTPDLQTYNGTSVRNIFRINDDLSLDSTFSFSTASVATSGSSIYQPHVSFTNDDKIIVTWNLPSYSGHASPYVIILNNDGSIFTDFISPITYTGTKVVYGTLVEDDKFYIFGSFDDYSGSGNNAIVRVDFSGNVDSSFVSQADSSTTIVGMSKLDDGNYLLLRSSGAYANYVDDVIKIDRYGNTIMCNVAPSPTPTPTPTLTPTLTTTPTLTPTTSCSITTQYLEVQLSESTRFKLILWNDSGYSSPATALCDYVISGCAYGDLGTVYCGTETITLGQHQHQFDLAPVLLPGEIVTGFTVNSYTLDGCVCPVNLIYAGIPTPTPTLTSTATPTLTSTATPTLTPTLTPTFTSTATPTLTSTATPTLTPTLTSTPTSSQTAWSPADFTGIWDWWSSDYGVNVINTDDVDQWTGHNGNVLTTFNTSYYPKKINSDSDFNNQPSVELNPGAVSSIDMGMRVDANANNTDKTFLLVCHVDSWVAGYDNLLITINEGLVPRMGIIANVSAGYLTFAIDSSISYVPYVGTVGNTPIYQFVKLSYNRANGEYIWGASTNNDFNTNIGTTTGATSDNYTGGKLGLSCFNGAFGFTPNMKVVEFIAIDGVPTTTEYNNYESYLTSKYGL